MRRWPFEKAAKLADAIAAALAPACERIEIAGSIRRRSTNPKDVEIVAVPRAARDLFGDIAVDEPHELDVHVRRLIIGGRLTPRLNSAGVRCMGPRHMRLVAVQSGLPIDLFCVLPPAQWGAILAIRTGPAEYSERLVTNCKKRGLQCVDGRLLTPRGRVVETPEEADFIRECGLPFEEPWQRR